MVAKMGMRLFAAGLTGGPGNGFGASIPQTPMYLFANAVGRSAQLDFIDCSSGSGRPPRCRFPIHPHVLRHVCGYELANDGHDTGASQRYLGHRNIQHTARYTARLNAVAWPGLALISPAGLSVEA